MRQVPRFARVLYPDGRVERFGIPDVIWESYQRKELWYRASYTKTGLVWEIKLEKNYQGDLRAGHYLDVQEQRVLRRMPSVYLSGQSPPDGCTVGTRREPTKRRPHYLFNTYYINLCTGE